MKRLVRVDCHLCLIVACLAFAFAWGAKHLKSDSITPAEYNSIFNVYENRLARITTFAETQHLVATKDETHPPGYFWLLNAWTRLVGKDLLALRVLSIFCGMLSLAFTYRLSQLNGNREQPLVALFLLAFSAYLAFYLHEVRMYALLALLSAFVAWSYGSAVRQIGNVRLPSLICLTLGCAAALYVHLFGFVLLGAVGLYHILFVNKDRRWLQISVAMALAGVLYLPWLPVTLQLLDVRMGFAEDSLTWFETLVALASIYNNGLSILVALLGFCLYRYRRRLGSRQLLAPWLVLFIVAISLAVNAVAPIIVARRIRYLIILAPLWVTALSTVFLLIPKWRLLRFSALAIWAMCFFLYSNSDDFDLYTNSKDQNRVHVPHYQTLLYEPEIRSSKSDFILSISQATGLSRKTVDYYGRQLQKWRGLIHIWNDESGNPAAISTDTRYDSVATMERWNFPIWLIYNPQETDLQAMSVFTEDFLARFHSCGRYLESADTVIELYAKQSIPCLLLTADNKQALRYDNGTDLANILVQHEAGHLDVSLWWTNTIASKYSISIQVFDAQNEKATQLDDVVGGSPLHSYSLDLSDLAPGDYTVKLILYDFLTMQGQPGTILADDQPFERSVAVGHISINA